jgi:hypothetical protein
MPIDAIERILQGKPSGLKYKLFDCPFIVSSDTKKYSKYF